ncbi:MAG: prolyl oligopeptidase family serine peptidase [Thermoanaerobaculales bacterium]|jgi:acetyl esterase/lipase|nr:prolyl oligopeptidase family serine peptidase [Thermoanaerobaculales bacterium]
MKRLPLALVLAGFVALPSPGAVAAAEPGATTVERGRAVIEGIRRHACDQAQRLPAARQTLLSPGAQLARLALRSACSSPSLAPGPEPGFGAEPKSLSTPGDGELLARERLVTGFGVAVDLVAYSSSDLAVGGLLCYPDDGLARSAVIHLHGGFGGIFENPDGDMLQTCINWALLHDRTAFAPSYRGQDGGEGQLELCLGEADDVAAGAIMLRSLEVADPARVGLVGGSVGGCVALRAAAKIPDLKAVVAFVPPSDWKALVDFHRTSWTPEVEPTCEGGSIDWDIGGPALAEVIDNVICGRPFCPDADYAARSTIPGIYVQTAPTLVVSAEADNVVPLDQQLLYSLLRQQLGHHIDVYVVGHCDPPASPAITLDSHIMVLDAFHALSPPTISSGLLFLMEALDS